MRHPTDAECHFLREFCSLFDGAGMRVRIADQKPLEFAVQGHRPLQRLVLIHQTANNSLVQDFCLEVVNRVSATAQGQAVLWVELNKFR